MKGAPIRRPELGELETFVLAARYGSITAASDALRLSKTAVAKRLRSLEALVGQQLLERSPRGVVLTEHGRRLIPEVEKLLRESEQVFQGLADLRAGADSARLSGLRSLSGAAAPSTEQALRETEHFFAEIFHSVFDAVAVLDPSDLRILEANDGFARIVGRPRTELIGRTGRDFNLASEEHGQALHEQALAGGVASRTLVLDTPTGVRHVDFSLRLLTISGSPYLLGIGRDVTAQVKHEQRLLKQAAQQQAIAELTVSALTGLDKDQIVEQAAALLASHLAAPLAGIWDLVDDEPQLRYVHGMTPEQIRSLGGTDDSATPFLASLHADGEICSDDITRDRRFAAGGMSSLGIRSVASVKTTGSTGDPVAIVVVASTEPGAFIAPDIDFVRTVANVLGIVLRAEKSADRERRQQLLLDNFTTLVEASTDPTVLLTLDGQYVYMNAAAVRFRATTPASTATSSVFGSLDTTTGQQLREIVWPETQRTGRWSGRFSVIRPSGEHFEGQLTTALVRDPLDGDARWVAAIFRAA